MSRTTVLPVLRELARCYQAFERTSKVHTRSAGLTPPQFDVIATLGNTPGLTLKELGRRTLITKGTLTGVVDRLVARGAVERLASRDDGRSTIVHLTPAGQGLFRSVFEPHLAFLAPAFESLHERDRIALEKHLRTLREALEKRRDALART